MIVQAYTKKLQRSSRNGISDVYAENNPEKPNDKSTRNAVYCIYDQ